MNFEDKLQTLTEKFSEILSKIHGNIEPEIEDTWENGDNTVMKRSFVLPSIQNGPIVLGEFTLSRFPGMITGSWEHKKRTYRLAVTAITNRSHCGRLSYVKKNQLFFWCKKNRNLSVVLDYLFSPPDTPYQNTHFVEQDFHRAVEATIDNLNRRGINDIRVGWMEPVFGVGFPVFSCSFVLISDTGLEPRTVVFKFQRFNVNIHTMEFNGDDYIYQVCLTKAVRDGQFFYVDNEINSVDVPESNLEILMYGW